MRGASPRGDVPRGAYRILGGALSGNVLELATATDSCGAVIGGPVIADEAAVAADLALGAAAGFLAAAAVSAETVAASAQAAGSAADESAAMDQVNYASVMLGQIESGAATADQMDALAMAAATLVEGAAAGFIAISAETGSTPVFAVEAAAAADAYTAAAMAYGHTVGATTAADAARATASALASYADPVRAGDMAYGRGSSDSTGPLRGAINITAALRGVVWLAPSPGPKGGDPH